MNKQRWEQVSALYSTVLTLKEQERTTVLSELCNGDKELRDEILSLFAAGESAGTFLLGDAMEDAAKQLTGVVQFDAGDRIGHYCLLGSIGTGSSGEVFRAHDETLGRDVAIKILTSGFSGTSLVNGQGEARVLASLNHKGIAAVYSLTEVNSFQAIVMEFVEGATLRERLARGSLPLREAIHFAHQLADALEYAHERGIIHRDLKPANLKITAEGNLKILDFGLAEVLHAGTETSQVLRDTSLIAGTPPYMALEQMEGKSVDRRADIWAFGVVLFEMFTGSRPWKGKNIAELMDNIKANEPNWQAVPGNFPCVLRDLLERCLRKDSRSRLRDIGDARLAIEEYAANSSGVPKAPASRALLHKLIYSIAVLALSCIAVIGTYRHLEQSSSLPLMRVSLELGSEAALNPSWQSIALSRDGRTIAYQSKAMNGESRLSLRRLDRQNSVALPATTGVTFSFFSPDGEWIGFFANGLLKKISAEGGPAIVLCDAPEPRGGAWGDDGQIIFASHAQGGLSRVSAEGGPVSAVTELDRSAGEMTHRWPQILPKSKTVLFTVNNTLIDYDFGTIQAQDLKTGRRQILVRGGYFGQYFAPGYLLYIHSGSLFAAAMSSALMGAGPLTLKGISRPVIERVPCNTVSGVANVAVSGTGSLIYTEPHGDPTLRRIGWMDEAGQVQVIRSAPDRYRSLRLSPDGKLFVLSIVREAGSDLWILDPSREKMTKLTFASGASEGPVWTPDGKHIAFVSNRDGRWRVYWMRADESGKAQPITGGERPTYPASFTPDGRHLAVVELNRQTSADVSILAIENPESDDPRPGPLQAFANSPAIENYPTFSPDGQFVAYSSSESGTLQTYVKAFPDNGRTWQISNRNGEKPVWSRDGQRLFYVEFNGKGGRIMDVDFRTRAGVFTASKPHVWSKGSVSLSDVYRDYDVASDGRHLAVYTEAEPSSGAETGRLDLLLNFSGEWRRRFPLAPP